MRDAGRRSQTHSHRLAMPDWLPLDVIVQVANALLLLMVLGCATHLRHPSAYLALHAGLAAVIFLLAKHADPRARASDPLTILHHWLPAIFVLLMYFELGILIPLLRDYADYRYDHALQLIDVWVMGDPIGAVARVASPLLSDVLTICYVAYYPFTVAVPLALYARGALDEYQRVAAIILTAFVVSYVGYYVWPALGPHRLFDGERLNVLSGQSIAGYGYGLLRGMPNEPPDAFPSGHTLIGVLVPALAWRWERRLFYWLAPVGVGIVLATIYLRLHYLTDLLASFLLAPVCWRLGAAIERRFRQQQPELAEAKDPSFEQVETEAEA